MKKKATQKTRSRALTLESLDPRLCLAVGLGAAGMGEVHVDQAPAHVSAWHNQARPHDVNQDQRVTPLNALAVINTLNARGARTLSAAEGETTTMVDVNGDSQVTAADCVAIVNVLNDVSEDSPAVEEAASEETSVDESPIDATVIDEESNGEEPDDDATVDDGTIDDLPTAGHDGGHSHRPSVEEVFARADTSQDGILTQDELPAEVWERLSAADTDGSAGITLEELTAYRREGGPHGPPKRGPGDCDAFARFDENGDGLLTSDELPEQAWLRPSPADSDGDEAVAPEELTAFQPAPPARDDFFARLDTDADGSISQDEVPECLWERIAPADTNGDGLISAEELATFRPTPPPQQGVGTYGMPKPSSGRGGGPEYGEMHARGVGSRTMIRSSRGGR